MNVLNLLLHRNGGSKDSCMKGHLLIYLLLATQPVPNLARSEFCPVVQGDVPHQKRLFVAASDAVVAQSVTSMVVFTLVTALHWLKKTCVYAGYSLWFIPVYFLFLQMHLGVADS